MHVLNKYTIKTPTTTHYAHYAYTYCKLPQIHSEYNTQSGYESCSPRDITLHNAARRELLPRARPPTTPSGSPPIMPTIMHFAACQPDLSPAADVKQRPANHDQPPSNHTTIIGYSASAMRQCSLHSVSKQPFTSTPQERQLHRYNKLKLIYKECLHKNYNEIFVPRNSRNVQVKSVSFYLKRFQSYGVSKMYNFLGHPL